MIIDKLLKNNPFQMDDKKKDDIFYKQIKLLNNHHYNNCQKYKKIIKSLYAYKPIKNKIKNFPMLPVKIFKKFDLFSVKKNQIVKKLVSSGTSGQELSKIFLDKKNAKNQVKVLKKIMTTVLGEKRLPMLIVDQNPKVLNRSIFNARTAAIYGFSVFGRNYCYLLDDKGNIDYNVLNNFLKMHGKEKFFIFGFTSLIFNNLIKKLLPNRVIGNFTNGILVHGGGWKKLEKVKIDNKIFKKKLFKKIKLKQIYNYYGLVEQTGSIFFECSKGNHFTTSIFSDIIIRDKNFNVMEKGKKGLIQLLSLLPTSYPGHNILTEDIGEIIDKKKCKCGLKGKFFLVHGRAKQAEIRGCSDTR